MRADLRAKLRGLGSALRAHGGEIAYYGAIALALTALAVGAERFRAARGNIPEKTTLPEVDFAAPASGEAPAPDAAEEEVPALPEGAELLRGYATTPAWNANLGFWESHPAADYRLPGGEVCCLCSGAVRAVERGGPLGGCVEVDCGGALLRYASICPREDLAPGDALSAGEAIGCADASMPGEAQLGPHLHLEVIAGGAAVNFADWADSAAQLAGD